MSTNKSFQDFQRLISIMKAKDFSLDGATNVNWRAAFKTLGSDKSELAEGNAMWMADDSWLTASISIDIPFHKTMKGDPTREFVVGNMHYRSITSVIKETLSIPANTRQFHYYPYEATWRRTPDSPPTELYGELYTSRAF
jgi:hypothetical protein